MRVRKLQCAACRTGLCRRAFSGVVLEASVWYRIRTRRRVRTSSEPSSTCLFQIPSAFRITLPKLIYMFWNICYTAYAYNNTWIRMDTSTNANSTQVLGTAMPSGQILTTVFRSLAPSTSPPSLSAPPILLAVRCCPHANDCLLSLSLRSRKYMSRVLSEPPLSATQPVASER